MKRKRCVLVLSSTSEPEWVKLNTRQNLKLLRRELRREPEQEGTIYRVCPGRPPRALFSCSSAFSQVARGWRQRCRARRGEPVSIKWDFPPEHNL